MRVPEIPTYTMIHTRAAKHRTGVCKQCGTSGRTEMALIAGRGKYIQRGGYGDGRAYSDRVEDYTELCSSCHKRYDRIAANLGVEPGIKPCSVENCDHPHLARGYCSFHYGRWKATGDPLRRNKAGKPVTYCTVEGCDKPCQGRGLCPTHYSRWKRHGDPLVIKDNQGRVLGT